jgi:hypothetical protein
VRAAEVPPALGVGCAVSAIADNGAYQKAPHMSRDFQWHCILELPFYPLSLRAGYEAFVKVLLILRGIARYASLKQFVENRSEN